MANNTIFLLCPICKSKLTLIPPNITTADNYEYKCYKCKAYYIYQEPATAMGTEKFIRSAIFSPDDYTR